jgi:hypothetical protein
MLDIQTLVEADESYRKLLIAELLALDRNWSFINNKTGGNPDQHMAFPEHRARCHASASCRTGAILALHWWTLH